MILTLEDHLTPDLQAKVAEVSFHLLPLCLSYILEKYDSLDLDLKENGYSCSCYHGIDELFIFPAES